MNVANIEYIILSILIFFGAIKNRNGLSNEDSINKDVNGDWGLGIGDWAQSPIPNPQSPIPKTVILLIINYIQTIIVPLHKQSKTELQSLNKVLLN